MLFSEDALEEAQLRDLTLQSARIIASTNSFPDTPMYGNVPIIMANLLAMYEEAVSDRDRKGY